MDMTLPKVHRARDTRKMWNNLHLRVSKNALIVNKLCKNKKARLPEKTGNLAFTLFANSL